MALRLQHLQCIAVYFKRALCLNRRPPYDHGSALLYVELPSLAVSVQRQLSCFFGQHCGPALQNANMLCNFLLCSFLSFLYGEFLNLPKV